MSVMCDVEVQIGMLMQFLTKLNWRRPAREKATTLNYRKPVRVMATKSNLRKPARVKDIFNLRK